jgi:hypothetical protein
MMKVAFFTGSVPTNLRMAIPLRFGRRIPPESDKSDLSSFVSFMSLLTEP